MAALRRHHDSSVAGLQIFSINAEQHFRSFWQQNLELCQITILYDTHNYKR